MGKFFNLDSPFVQFMNRVADLMWLNILFVICCIPVITIGDSITAMYYITLKMTRDEESYITKGFFKSFKQNFVQATIIWLIFLLLGGLLVLDYMIVSGRLGFSIGNSSVESVMQVLLIAVLIFYLFTLTFVFPLLSKFDNSVKNTIKNAFIISVRHFPVTLGCIAIWILAALALIYIPIMTLFSIFILFSVVAFGCSFMYVRVFDKYLPADATVTEENEETGEASPDENEETAEESAL
ncbi:MAG: DUF624 domain-containing protein [Lachnospiraceae bacterium]|nr:DUF624 domain-containing protein [Lachnospiraceae bacterium]